MPRPARPLATRRARALTGAALSVCLLTGAGYAFAADPDPQQEKDRVDGQLSDAQGDLHETSKDLLDAYSKLKSTRSKLPGARSAASRPSRRRRRPRASTTTRSRPTTWPRPTRTRPSGT